MQQRMHTDKSPQLCFYHAPVPVNASNVQSLAAKQPILDRTDDTGADSLSNDALQAGHVSVVAEKFHQRPQGGSDRLAAPLQQAGSSQARPAWKILQPSNRSVFPFGFGESDVVPGQPSDPAYQDWPKADGKLDSYPQRWSSSLQQGGIAEEMSLIASQSVGLRSPRLGRVDHLVPRPRTEASIRTEQQASPPASNVTVALQNRPEPVAVRLALYKTAVSNRPTGSCPPSSMAPARAGAPVFELSAASDPEPEPGIGRSPRLRPRQTRRQKEGASHREGHWPPGFADEAMVPAPPTTQPHQHWQGLPSRRPTSAARARMTERLRLQHAATEARSEAGERKHGQDRNPAQILPPIGSAPGRPHWQLRPSPNRHGSAASRWALGEAGRYKDVGLGSISTSQEQRIADFSPRSTTSAHAQGQRGAPLDSRQRESATRSPADKVRWRGLAASPLSARRKLTVSQQSTALAQDHDERRSDAKQGSRNHGKIVSLHKQHLLLHAGADGSTLQQRAEHAPAASSWQGQVEIAAEADNRGEHVESPAAPQAVLRLRETSRRQSLINRGLVDAAGSPVPDTAGTGGQESKSGDAGSSTPAPPSQHRHGSSSPRWRLDAGDHGRHEQLTGAELLQGRGLLRDARGAVPASDAADEHRAPALQQRHSRRAGAVQGHQQRHGSKAHAPVRASSPDTPASEFAEPTSPRDGDQLMDGDTFLVSDSAALGGGSPAHDALNTLVPTNEAPSTPPASKPSSKPEEQAALAGPASIKPPRTISSHGAGSGRSHRPTRRPRAPRAPGAPGGSRPAPPPARRGGQVQEQKQEQEHVYNSTPLGRTDRPGSAASRRQRPRRASTLVVDDPSTPFHAPVEDDTREARRDGDKAEPATQAAGQARHRGRRASAFAVNHLLRGAVGSLHDHVGLQEHVGLEELGDSGLAAMQRPAVRARSRRVSQVTMGAGAHYGPTAAAADASGRHVYDSSSGGARGPLRAPREIKRFPARRSARRPSIVDNLGARAMVSDRMEQGTGVHALAGRRGKLRAAASFLGASVSSRRRSTGGIGVAALGQPALGTDLHEPERSDRPKADGTVLQALHGPSRRPPAPVRAPLGIDRPGADASNDVPLVKPKIDAGPIKPTKKERIDSSDQKKAIPPPKEPARVGTEPQPQRATRPSGSAPAPGQSGPSALSGLPSFGPSSGQKAPRHGLSPRPTSAGGWSVVSSESGGSDRNGEDEQGVDVVGMVALQQIEEEQEKRRGKRQERR